MVLHIETTDRIWHSIIDRIRAGSCSRRNRGCARVDLVELELSVSEELRQEVRSAFDHIPHHQVVQVPDFFNKNRYFRIFRFFLCVYGLYFLRFVVASWKNSANSFKYRKSTTRMDSSAVRPTLGKSTLNTLSTINDTHGN